MSLQPGDVPDTFADVSDHSSDFDYSPSTQIEYGIENSIRWYREYYGV